MNLSVEASETNLTEADRPFEPYNSRWPEPEDLVRFVDGDNRHLLHNRAGTCQAGDRFWFQGVLYRCIADPNDPSSLIVKSTYHVLNADGRVLPVEEFAVARGDSLDEVYSSQLATAGFVGGTVDGSSDILLTSFDGGALPSGLVGGQQPGDIQSGASSGGVNGMPTDFGFAGQRYDSSTGLIYMGARYYDPALGRFISPDTIVPDPGDPQLLNRYSYVRNNPLRYTDPDGHTLRSALDLIREYREDINSIAEQYNLDPVLLAGVVFAENRNDYNWIRGQDWSSIFTLRLFGGPEVKNLISPLVKDNPSIGITEVSVAVAAMMDNPGLVPDNYADLSWEERSALHEQIAANLSKDERQRILDSLADPRTSLEYTAKYLNFLAGQRDYGENYALWLSDYNRGLSGWDTTTEYGRRIDVYRVNIEHALNVEPIEWICVGGYGCGVAYDRMIYGKLP